jgi:hypothetical protein
MNKTIGGFNMYAKSKFRTWSPLKIVAVVIGGILLAGLLAFLFGYVVMLLWNWLMPEIFGLVTIGYWQAVGLIILAKLIFGFGSHSGDGGSKKKHHSKNSCDPSFKENFKSWDHYDTFWKEKGKQAFDDYVREKETQDLSHEDLTNKEKTQ